MPSRFVGFSLVGSSVQNSFLSRIAIRSTRVERPQNVFVRTQAKSAQENGAEELALAVDADVQNVLLVVFELDPRSAVRNDLAEEVAAVVRVSKNTPGERCNWLTMTRSVPLMMNVPFCGHQRNFAEENFLLLDVADRTVARLRVLVVDGEPDGDLERRGVRHAALFALRHVVLQLQADRVAALVAEIRSVRVVGAALVSKARRPDETDR